MRKGDNRGQRGIKPLGLLGIHQLAQTAKWCPQATYATMQKSLQMEWQYRQWVSKMASLCFLPSRMLSSNDFLDTLFSILFYLLHLALFTLKQTETSIVISCSPLHHR